MTSIQLRSMFYLYMFGFVVVGFLVAHIGYILDICTHGGTEFIAFACVLVDST